MSALKLVASTPILLAVTLALASGCKTAQLSGGGAQVATSSAAPVDSGWEPAQCKSLGYIVGRGGGSFGGGLVANEDLIEYAMNDLRNKAAEKGANFVQHDTPTMGQAGSDGDTTTSTATVSGTAYECDGEPRRAGSTVASADNAPKEPKSPATACVPGATQPCTGPGGCTGGQFCTDDGSRFSQCDCGSASSDEAPTEAAPDSD